MNRWFACGCIWVLLTCHAISDGAQVASWIWQSDNGTQATDVSFDKTYRVSQPPVRGRLRFAAQYANCRVQLNDQFDVMIDAYDPMLDIDVTDRMVTGDHKLVVTCEKIPGPSALFLVLDLSYADGSSLSIVSDESWATQRRVVALDAVSRKLLIPESYRVGISPVENYEQWKEALGGAESSTPATFKVADGFEVQLVRSAKEDEDSWVSFSFDDEGRMTIAKEQVGLLRMTLSPDGNSVIRTEAIDETLKECRGLVWRNGDLFANANDSKALYRLSRQKNGELSAPVQLFRTTGGAGHGRNDLCFDPDGMLYSIHGDSVDLPSGARDYTSPYREARRGKKTSEGHLIRFDPSSGETELLTAGLRNPFGIDLNADGEAFTYDADAEYDMGASWYRPTRVNHLVIGGDYGWRGVTKSWPPYFCDRAGNAHPNLDIGKGSPTAIKFGGRSHFPQRYREALFVLDWAYGRVLAVNMIPRGASYLMAAETFLQGRPLNVTDIDFAPDGSMYLITGGRKTQSAIYRVRFGGEEDDLAQETETFRSDSDAFATQARMRRRDFESRLLREPQRSDLPDIWNGIDDPDPRIQYAASNLLERYPLRWWSQTAIRQRSPRGLLSIARSGDRTLFGPVLETLNTISIPEKSLAEQDFLLQAYRLILDSSEGLNPKTVASASRRLAAAYPSDHFTTNRLLSQILIGMDDVSATAVTVELLRTATDPIERFHYLFVLRNAKRGWTDEDRATYFRLLGRAEELRGGAGMPDFLTKIREEAIAGLSPQQRATFVTELNHQRDTTEPPSTPPRKFVRRWTVDELLKTFDDSRAPDRIRGRQMFVAASCSRCHRVGDEGTLVGPDLTAAGSRYRRRDLLTAIIDPSLVIAENYRSVQILTDDGKTLTGQIALGGDYRSPILRLAADPNHPFDVVEIDKTEIVSQKFSPVSWMPSDLLNTLTAEEVQDLVAFIESGGAPR